MNLLNFIFLLTINILVSHLHAESDIFKNFENRFNEINKSEVVQAKSDNVQNNGIATLDLKLALLLHPLMKDYNFTVHSFIKPIPKNLNVPLNFYLKNRVKESREMVLKSKKLYKKLQDEQLQIQQKISTLIYHKPNDIRRIMSSDSPNTEQKLETFRNDFQKKINQLNQRQIEITQEIIKTYNSSFGIHYMTQKQRDNVLSTIEKEVFDSAKIVLERKNLTILLNGNYLKSTKPFPVSKLAWVDKNFNGVNALNFYFQRQTIEVDNQIQAYPDQAGADLFRNYYANFNHVPAIFGKNYNNQFILLGDTNITKATLQVLYKKYNKLDIIQDILNFIQKIKENQHE